MILPTVVSANSCVYKDECTFKPTNRAQIRSFNLKPIKVSNVEITYFDFSNEHVGIKFNFQGKRHSLILKSLRSVEWDREYYMTVKTTLKTDVFTEADICSDYEAIKYDLVITATTEDFGSSKPELDEIYLIVNKEYSDDLCHSDLQVEKIPYK